ncbi:hypothetical protein GCM10022221_78660 [Actinocorallia aurea]
MAGASAEDVRWLEVACELAGSCPPSETAFSVGAVIVGADGKEVARGFSREVDDKVHAEEAALGKVSGMDLAGATVYSSLEPCARRLSRPRSCARLIVERGIRRVVFAWREPVLFVEGDGLELLEREGVEVVEVPALAARAKLPNAHLL